jgi:hypothetical protein
LNEKWKGGSPTPPPLLLAGGLLFWGWQTGLWVPVGIMAVPLEMAPLVRFRWSFTPRELNRAADLCALLFVGMAAYLFFAGRTVYVVFTLLKWLPMSLFPLIFCQVYGDRDDVDLQSVSLFLRTRRSPRLDSSPRRIDLSFPYFGICLLSAGFANRRDGFFYPAFLALAGWALWAARPRRYSLVSWAAMLSAAALLGFGGHQGLHRLQQYLELKGMEFFAGFRGLESDPFQSITGFGDVVGTKISGRVLFRAQPLENAAAPLLLRESSYNRYHDGKWFAMGTRFQGVLPAAANPAKIPPAPPLERGGKDGRTPASKKGFRGISDSKGEFGGISGRWILGLPPEGGRNSRVRVMAPMARRQSLLKVPTGTWKVDRLPVSFLEINELGAIRVADGPGLLDYEAVWNQSTPLDDPPMANDRDVPEEETPAIRQLAGELELADLSPRAAAARINRHFAFRFQYDLGVRHQKNPTYLADFLARSRTGHCEYFATAAALLLRSAGIPARYAVGYSLHEYSELEKALVARERHAHAWAIYWDGGRWRDLDATPPDWRPLEAEAASPLERLSDIWSWVRFRFEQWRWRPDRNGLPAWALWLILPLALFLLRRLARKRRIRRKAEAPVSAVPSAPPPGADSPFYEIEARLTALGHPRRAGETMGRWVARVNHAAGLSSPAPRSNRDGSPPAPADVRSAPPPVPRELLQLHYRHRFGPEPMPRESLAKLSAGVRDWLDRHPPPAPRRRFDKPGGF